MSFVRVDAVNVEDVDITNPSLVGIHSFSGVVVDGAKKVDLSHVKGAVMETHDEGENGSNTVLTLKSGQDVDIYSAKRITISTAKNTEIIDPVHVEIESADTVRISSTKSNQNRRRGNSFDERKKILNKSSEEFKKLIDESGKSIPQRRASLTSIIENDSSLGESMPVGITGLRRQVYGNKNVSVLLSPSDTIEEQILREHVVSSLLENRKIYLEEDKRRHGELLEKMNANSKWLRETEQYAIQDLRRAQENSRRAQENLRRVREDIRRNDIHLTFQMNSLIVDENSLEERFVRTEKDRVRAEEDRVRAEEEDRVRAEEDRVRAEEDRARKSAELEKRENEAKKFKEYQNRRLIELVRRSRDDPQSFKNTPF